MKIETYQCEECSKFRQAPEPWLMAFLEQEDALEVQKWNDEVAAWHRSKHFCSTGCFLKFQYRWFSK